MILFGYHQQGLSYSLFNHKRFLLISENIRDTAIEVKTQRLNKIGRNGFFQCIALSKRPDIILNTNDTYIINVDGKTNSFFLRKENFCDF